MNRAPQGSQQGNAYPLRYVGWLALFWTLAVIAIGYFVLRSALPGNEEILLSKARSLSAAQLNLLEWSSAQGGVYVGEHGTANSSPYLNTTSDGGPAPEAAGVRLISPTAVGAAGRLDSGMGVQVLMRLVSHRPINPDNQAKAWELAGIDKLLSPDDEFYSVDKVPSTGRGELHYLRAIPMRESCLGCHAESNFESGELRGAVSITIPVPPASLMRDGATQKMLRGVAMIWSIGLLFIGFGGRAVSWRQRAREETSEMLSRSEANLRALFNSTQSGTILIDRQFRVQAFNAKAAQWYHELNGIDLGQGQMILDHWPKEVRGEFVNRVFQALAGRVYSQEQVLKGQGGRSYWYEVSYSPVHERDRVLGVCLGLLNVSERKLAEAAQIESEERYRHLMESVSEGISITDVHGSILICNPAAERIFSAMPGQLIGRNLREFVSGEDQTILDHERSLRRAGESSGYSLSIRNLDGEVRRLQMASSPRFDDNGSYAGAFSLLRDITDTVRTEQALRRSEERYSELVHNVVEGISLTDQAGNILFANPSTERMLGCGPGELIGRNLMEFVDPGYHQTMVAERKKRRDGLSSSYEMRIRRLDGSYRDVLVSASPRYDEGGAYVGSFGLIQDITDRKLAEAQIRESEERYRTLVELSPDAILIQQQGRIVFANAAAERLLGASGHEQIMGLPVVRLVHPDYRDQAERRMRTVLEEGTPSPISEEKLIRLDGKTLDVEVTGQLFTYHNEPAIQLIARDISSRIKAERDLRDSEERYREFVEGTSDIIVQIDKLGRLTFLNTTARKLSGRSEENVTGLRALRFIRAGDRRRVRSLLLDAIDRRDDSVAFDCGSIEPDGTAHEILWSANLHYDSGRWFSGANLIGRDITHQKQMQEQILQRQKEESIVTLAGGIAHDFNNILLGVLGSASLLRMNISEDDPNHELCEVISTSANQMADLTQKLLAYARGGRYQTKAVDVNRLVGDSLTMLRSTIPPQVSVTTALAEGIWPVEGDPGQLNQVLLNLCINACEAMGERGGSLHLETRNQHLSTIFQAPSQTQIPPGDYIHITVTDTGHGINEATLKRIFEPFFSTKFQGRGLGLAASAGIVVNHAGCMYAVSRLGQGTTFHVYLPRSSRDVAQVVAEQTKSATGAETILVVDDEDVVRNTARVMLERNGYKVMLAADGPEGLEIFLKHRDNIDLIIMDIQMPKMSGAEMYEKIKEIEPLAKVIVSSGYDEEFFTSAGGSGQLGGYGMQNLPSEEFLQKPYRATQLVSRVRAVLDRPAGSGKLSPPLGEPKAEPKPAANGAGSTDDMAEASEQAADPK